MPPGVDPAFRRLQTPESPGEPAGIREMAAASCEPTDMRSGGGESAIPELRIRRLIG